MLSRVADSIFWMSRYIERAENVARFTDVNWHLILDSASGQDEQWQALLNTTGDHEGFAKRYGKAGRENVIQFVTFDTANPNSIISCLRFARENARTSRDVISTEMWEQINSFYLMMKDAAAGKQVMEAPYEFFKQVRIASQLFVGISDATMSHGEGWNFCRVGRFLERTDKTSRILDVKYYLLRPPEAGGGALVDDIQWAAVLNAASALEMYRKRHRRIAPEKVVEFLMLDPEFPRAVLYCVKNAESALLNIIGEPRGAYNCLPAEQLGELYSELSKAEIQNIIITGLHEYVDALQTKLNGIGEAVHETFFSMEKAPVMQSQSQSQSTGQTQSQSQTPPV